MKQLSKTMVKNAWVDVPILFLLFFYHTFTWVLYFIDVSYFYWSVTTHSFKIVTCTASLIVGWGFNIRSDGSSCWASQDASWRYCLQYQHSEALDRAVCKWPWWFQKSGILPRFQTLFHLIVLAWKSDKHLSIYCLVEFTHVHTYSVI